MKLKGADFMAAVHDAARVRPGMVRSAIKKIGTAGWTSYFDVTDNPAGRAYVDFVRLRRGRHMPFLERETLAIEAAVDFSERGIAPASPYVLAARAAIVRWECESRLLALEAMQRCAPLREDEQRWCGERSAALNELAGRAKVVRDSLPADAGPTWENANEAPRSALTASNDLIDIKDAWRCIEGQAQYALTEIRALLARFVHMVPLFIDESGETEGPRRSGRRVSRYMERFAFECYAAERWGTPEWAELYVLAGQTLGSLRDPEPLLRTIRDSSLSRCYEGVAAAMAILDTGACRDALKELTHSVSASGSPSRSGTRGLAGVLARAGEKRPFALEKPKAVETGREG